MQANNELSTSFRQIALTPEGEHSGTVGMMSYLYRPYHRESSRFSETRTSLSRFFLLAHRPQWRCYKGEAVPSNVVAVYTFSYNRLTGRVSIDAHADEACNPAAWEVAVSRSARALAAHTLNPRHNRSGARAAVLLHGAVLAAVRHGHPPLAAPALPAFSFVFHARRPPRMERTGALFAAVRQARPDLVRAPDAALDDALCRSVFESLLVREGSLVYAPQWLFGREPGERFAVHPTDGTLRPEAAAEEWARCGNWVLVDGAWCPRAQEPMNVVADLSGLLGRESLAAWELLVEAGHLPAAPHAEWAAACTDAEWDRFREETLVGLFPSGRGCPLAAAWRRRNAGAEGLDDDEVAALAFHDVRRPYVFEGESRVGVVRLQGYPGPGTMSWRTYGLDVNLFNVWPDWEPGLAPITPRDIERLRRGLPVLPPGRGPRPRTRRAR